jgi:hypothetical protein
MAVPEAAIGDRCKEAVAWRAEFSVAAIRSEKFAINFGYSCVARLPVTYTHLLGFLNASINW